MKKCEYPEGVHMEIAGIPVDPCVYETEAVYKNVTVEILKCRNCGHVDVTWYAQENTEDITEEWEEDDA